MFNPEPSEQAGLHKSEIDSTGGVLCSVSSQLPFINNLLKHLGDLRTAACCDFVAPLPRPPGPPNVSRLGVDQGFSSQSATSRYRADLVIHCTITVRGKLVNNSGVVETFCFLTVASSLGDWRNSSQTPDLCFRTGVKMSVYRACQDVSNESQEI